MSVEKTKENIKASELDKKDRKELFDKFTKAGGKVINEEPKRQSISIDKEKQKAYLKMEAEARAKRSQNREKITLKRKSLAAGFKKDSKKPLQKKSSKSSFSSKLKINFKCWLMGISPFGGSFIKNKFCIFMDQDASNAILNLSSIFFEFFKVNPKHAESLIKELDKRNPIYIEILEKAAQLYDKHELVKFSEILNKFPNQSVPLKLAEKQIISLLKKLFPFYNYVGMFRQAIDIGYKALANIDGKNSAVYSGKRRQGLASVDLVFQKLFPKLYWLYCKIKGYEKSIYSQAFGDELGYTQDQYLGQRSAADSLKTIQQRSQGERLKPAELKKEPPAGSRDKEKEDTDATRDDNGETKEESKEEVKEEVKEEERQDLPKAIRIGLKLMKELSYEKMQVKFNDKGKSSFLDFTDKVFLTYLLYREFDHEFSFILTTSKIVLKPDYSSGTKINYNERLSDIFLLTDEIYDKFEQYSKITEEFFRLKEIQPTPAGYIQHMKRVTEIENKRVLLGRNFRSLVLDMMDKIVENLKVLIRDIAGPKQIVSNGDDILTFDKKIEGTKKLNNHSVNKALKITFVFVTAFVYRLKHSSGDLSGITINIEKDIFRQDLAATATRSGRSTGEKNIQKEAGHGDDKTGNSALNTEKDTEEEPLEKKAEPEAIDLNQKKGMVQDQLEDLDL